MNSTRQLCAAVVLGLVLGFGLRPASAQDPAIVNAQTIKVKLENDRVRVLEVAQGGTTVQAELFPDISIGDAPAENPAPVAKGSTIAPAANGDKPS